MKELEIQLSKVLAQLQSAEQQQFTDPGARPPPFLTTYNRVFALSSYRQTGQRLYQKLAEVLENICLLRIGPVLEGQSGFSQFVQHFNWVDSFLAKRFVPLQRFIVTQLGAYKLCGDLPVLPLHQLTLFALSSSTSPCQFAELLFAGESGLRLGRLSLIQRGEPVQPSEQSKPAFQLLAKYSILEDKRALLYHSKAVQQLNKLTQRQYLQILTVLLGSESDSPLTVLHKLADFLSSEGAHLAQNQCGGPALQLLGKYRRRAQKVWVQQFKGKQIEQECDLRRVLPKLSQAGMDETGSGNSAFALLVEKHLQRLLLAQGDQCRLAIVARVAAELQDLELGPLARQAVSSICSEQLQKQTKERLQDLLVKFIREKSSRLQQTQAQLVLSTMQLLRDKDYFAQRFQNMVFWEFVRSSDDRDRRIQLYDQVVAQLKGTDLRAYWDIKGSFFVAKNLRAPLGLPNNTTLTAFGVQPQGLLKLRVKVPLAEWVRFKQRLECKYEQKHVDRRLQVYQNLSSVQLVVANSSMRKVLRLNIIHAAMAMQPGGVEPETVRGWLLPEDQHHCQSLVDFALQKGFMKLKEGLLEFDFGFRSRSLVQSWQEGGRRGGEGRERELAVEAAVMRVLKGRRGVGTAGVVRGVQQGGRVFRASEEEVRMGLCRLVEKEFVRRDELEREVFHWIG